MGDNNKLGRGIVRNFDAQVFGADAPIREKASLKDGAIHYGKLHSVDRNPNGFVFDDHPRTNHRLKRQQQEEK